MTLLVRDEEDIVGRNIDFHLTHGVDHIVVTDNGSTDRTAQVLAAHERRDCLTVFNEPEHTHSQSRWVNRMAEFARQELDADIVFHCDADEFWFPLGGNLKYELMRRQRIDALRVPVRNVLLADRGGLEEFPEDAYRIVMRPRVAENRERESLWTSLYLFEYGRKVMFRSKGRSIYVGEGNHGIVEPKRLTIEGSHDIRILHFPVRSFAQFERKVTNGARALEANQELGPTLAWHWKRWYDAYKVGDLWSEYRRLMGHEGLSEEAAKAVELIDLRDLVELGSRTLHGCGPAGRPIVVARCAEPNGRVNSSGGG